jgi:uncharacterized protein YdcH (DUF465 family)
MRDVNISKNAFLTVIPAAIAAGIFAAWQNYNYKISKIHGILLPFTSNSSLIKAVADEFNYDLVKIEQISDKLSPIAELKLKDKEFSLIIEKHLYEDGKIDVLKNSLEKVQSTAIDNMKLINFVVDKNFDAAQIDLAIDNANSLISIEPFDRVCYADCLIKQHDIMELPAGEVEVIE